MQSKKLGCCLTTCPNNVERRRKFCANAKKILPTTVRGGWTFDEVNGRLNPSRDKTGAYAVCTVVFTRKNKASTEVEAESTTLLVAWSSSGLISGGRPQPYQKFGKIVRTENTSKNGATRPARDFTPKTLRTLHRFYKRYNGIAVVLVERNLGPYLASSSRSCRNRASFPAHSAAYAPCSPSFNRWAKPINRALFRSTAASPFLVMCKTCRN